MAHIGILQLADTLHTVCTPTLLNSIRSFVMQGKHLHMCYDAQKGVVTYILFHPDFTEEDGTEYMLIISRDESGDEYISGLQAITATGFNYIKRYEKPYV